MPDADNLTTKLFERLAAGLGSDAPAEFSAEVLTWGAGWVGAAVLETQDDVDGGAGAFADLEWFVEWAAEGVARKLRDTAQPVVVDVPFLERVEATIKAAGPTRLCDD